MISTMPRRIRLNNAEGFYHITTRVVDKIYRFTPDENERNVNLLRRVETFSGVQVISYCFMSNHLHILLRVPPREDVSEKELLSRVQVLYGEKYRIRMEGRWEACKKFGCKDLVLQEQDALLKRMYDMGAFMKTLKQRLTISFNARTDREGTLWEDRYKSILLEPSVSVLSAVAAYIDLNPVRAKMVSDPALYRFSSYGEACRGDVKARAGLCRIYQEGEKELSWEDVAPTYRMRLEWKALPADKRGGTRMEEIREAMENRGGLSLPEVLGDRCPFMTTGFALGDIFFLLSVISLHPRRNRKRRIPTFFVADPPPDENPPTTE